MTYNHEPIRAYKALHAASNVYTRQQIARIAKRLRNQPKDETGLLVKAALVNRLSDAQRERYESRRDSRITHLAHMFLKGTPWAAAEDPKLTETEVSFDALVNRIKDFAPERDLRDVTQSLAGWFDAWYTARG